MLNFGTLPQVGCKHLLDLMLIISLLECFLQNIGELDVSDPKLDCFLQSLTRQTLGLVSPIIPSLECSLQDVAFLPGNPNVDILPHEHLLTYRLIIPFCLCFPHVSNILNPYIAGLLHSRHLGIVSKYLGAKKSILFTYLFLKLTFCMILTDAVCKSSSFLRSILF